MQKNRILSGMRPTGRLHIGHFHGALKNWVQLQEEYDCFYFVADWHALTTDYAQPTDLQRSTQEMVVDWLAAGIDPQRATIFVQSRVPEHAELFLLLAMMMPLSWLERVPSYKDQQENLTDKDLSTYGFLGYPLLQAADILLYDSDGVPVGADQVPHIELTREVARRFNSLYGGSPKPRDLGEKMVSQIEDLRHRYRERGDRDALLQAESLIKNIEGLSTEEKAEILGEIKGTGRRVLHEPQALLTAAAKVLGTDGRKMSKSYGNAILLREDPETLKSKLRAMQTDPARVRRSDAGEPERCPVWPLHQIYSSSETQSWVLQGCRSAGIGCIECKTALQAPILHEQEEQRERAAPFLQNPQRVAEILAAGNQRASTVARHTLDRVRHALRLV